MSAVHVRAACAAYSSIWPTTVRRISGFRPRLNLDQRRHGVLIRQSRWSTAHRAAASADSAIPCSRAMRIQRRGSSGRTCLPSSSSRCSAMKGLQFVLRLESLALERFKPALLVSGVDALGHGCDPPCGFLAASQRSKQNRAGHTNRTRLGVLAARRTMTRSRLETARGATGARGEAAGVEAPPFRRVPGVRAQVSRSVSPR